MNYILYWFCLSMMQLNQEFRFFYYFTAAESKTLKVLLSFAVGGLLGDVFLHLLPEAWSGDVSKSG